MADHAILSASGAHRWLACTPSARFELQFPKTTSAYAEEGTLAHSVAELTTRFYLGEIDENTYEDKLAELSKSSYPVVDHKHGDKHDNRASQLEWCTIAENTRRAHALGLFPPP